MKASLHYLLMKTHAALNKKISSQAYKIGLTSGQPKILEYLFYHNGSDQKSIAANCEIEPATVGSLLLRMEAAKLIDRKQCGGNRRSLFIFLTDKGHLAAAQMNNIFGLSEKQAIDKMSKEELSELMRLLTKVYSNLTDSQLIAERSADS